MFSDTLDGLVLRMNCTDGVLFVCRPYVYQISITIREFQKDHKTDIINDVVVPFTRKIVKMFLYAANPMTNYPTSDISDNKDEIISCMKWFGPNENDDIETIVLECINSN